MTMTIVATAFFLAALNHAVLAFGPLYPNSRKHSRLFSANSDAEEQKRMALVRSLQRAYYMSNSNSTVPTLDKSTGILHDLPLWRVQWTELPGRSNVLNVHEPIYTNMYESILCQPKPWYVGHLFLPGGSKNLKSEERCYQLKTWEEEASEEGREEERSAVVGTLMRVSDFRRLSDGRLILLVQALERFVVVNCKQVLPYSIADVQILPDFDDARMMEAEANAIRSRAVLESFRYHDYEYDVDFALPLTDSKYLSVTDLWGPDIAKCLPFVPYSQSIDPLQLDPVEVEPREGDETESPNETSLESRLLEGGILRPPPSLAGLTRRDTDLDGLEDQLWTALAEFAQAASIVLPQEVLCLLPPGRDWGGPTPVDRISADYPAHRRQRRLSFAASLFMEQTKVGAGLRQVWLETPGTKGRLSAILERFEALNSLLLGEFQ